MTAQADPRTPAQRRAQLRRQVTQVLSTLLDPSTQCALVDFPLHPNAGDSAIWLGQRTALRELGVSVAYTCDENSFHQQDLLTHVPDGVILINGGGNLGDLWPARQHFREHLIQTFPHHRIVQLPQSICFRNKKNLRRAQAIIDAHPDLILLVRDHHSLHLARTHFTAPSLLCPDIAFALPAAATTRQPTHDVVWLTRSDHETTGAPLPAPHGRTLHTDWIDESTAPPEWRSQKDTADQRLRTALTTSHEHHDSPWASAMAAAHDELAELQLTRGYTLLDAGEVIVTDRLHGHLLSLLLDRPHILLPDRYGKIHNNWHTWTHDWPGVHWATNPYEAAEQARALRRNGRGLPNDRSV